MLIRGRGPGEYQYITNCNYDSERQILSIYDNIGQKLILYRTDGEFLKDIPVKMGRSGLIVSTEMINLPNGNYLGYSPTLFESVGNYSGLWEMDLEGNHVKSLFLYDIHVWTMFAGGSSLQQLADGTISIRDLMHHDIYHYKDDMVKRYISYEIKDSKLIKYQGTDVSLDIPFMFCRSSHESKDYIISNWVDESRDNVFGLYDKRRNKMRFTDTFDNFGLDAIWTSAQVNSSIDNILLINLSGTRIEQMLNDEATSEKARKILNTLKDGRSETEMESMNPILELLYLKI